jgi:signal peptidase I
MERIVTTLPPQSGVASMPRPQSIVPLAVAFALAARQIACPGVVDAQSDSLPGYLRDRGPGQPTSMFGTYIKRGDVLVYPFFEYYRDRNFEYKPAELGYVLDRDFRGRYRASEGILFLGYGVTDWLALEFEAAVIRATLDKAGSDPSSQPARLKASGVGDVEGQVRIRWARETDRRPQVFSYFEITPPRQRKQPLIGTPDWEFAFGTGITRGFRWGTITARVAVLYEKADKKLTPGEYAIEYLRRLSPSLRLYLGFEGTEDEVEQIAELQIRVARGVTLKLNNAFGLTAKATDWAPEVGLLFALPTVR